MLKALPLIAALLTTTSCVDYQNRFAPSRARRADTGPDTRGLLPFFDMKDAASLRHFAWGVSPNAFDGERRKLEPRAAVRFQVDAAAGLHFVADLASAVPQRVRVRVNARERGEWYDSGNTHIESPLQPCDLLPGEATLVEFQSDAGLSLYRAGFLKK